MQCEIRQKDCYCVSAPMGNPFPCTTMNIMEKLKQHVGEQCQFLNLDLAEDWNGKKVPCCKECKTPCEYQCRNSDGRKVEENPEKPVATSQEKHGDESSDCPPDIRSCIRQEWGTDPEQQEAGRKECKKCWKEYKKLHKIVDSVDEYLVSSSQQDIADKATEVDHYTVGDKTTENSYGYVRGEVVNKYLVTEYMNSSKECEINVPGFTYKILKRSDVTVFYDSSGRTLFDIENERLEQEYQSIKSNERQHTFAPSKCIRDQSKKCEIKNDEDCPSECCFCCEKRGICCSECEASVVARIKKPPVEQEEEPVIEAEYQEVVEDEVRPEQPELPVLKNNEQRREFIEDYETWPVWIYTEETGEKYYKYDLPDGDSFVIKVYYHRCFDFNMETANIEDRYRDGWGGEEYYLIKKGKHFRDCLSNKGWLIQKLKEIQKVDH